jgi:hypothetical protein
MDIGNICGWQPIRFMTGLLVESNSRDASEMFTELMLQEAVIPLA